MELTDRIFVAGHRGLVGSAILRRLKLRGFTRIITRTHIELDLTNQNDVKVFFKAEKPDYVVVAAAKVGGIHANNTYSANFIYENIMIEANIIDAAYRNNVKRLLFLGSTCIYPKSVKQPMQEDALLTGVLEPTNEPYAIAKIAGIKLCESYNKQHGTDYRSVMPTNLYGSNDNFHLENSHVLPAILRKIHLAKLLEEKKWNAIKKDAEKNSINGISSNSTNEEIIRTLGKYGIQYDVKKSSSKVYLWGTGRALREFLYVDDMALASIFVLELDKKIYDTHTKPSLSHINIGTGVDISIFELAQNIKNIVGYKGEISFDAAKPDGTARKLIDTSRLSMMGWNYSVSLNEGLKKTYNWYLT
jgi:GDP-L-fucose synthase